MKRFQELSKLPLGKTHSYEHGVSNQSKSFLSTSEIFHNTVIWGGINHTPLLHGILTLRMLLTILTFYLHHDVWEHSKVFGFFCFMFLRLQNGK
jgi:hypothetical protein